MPLLLNLREMCRPAISSDFISKYILFRYSNRGNDLRIEARSDLSISYRGSLQSEQQLAAYSSVSIDRLRRRYDSAPSHGFKTLWRLFTITIAQQMHGFGADIATDYRVSQPTAPSCVELASRQRDAFLRRQKACCFHSALRYEMAENEVLLLLTLSKIAS